MAKILIVGTGAFGTALANVLLNNGHIVNIFGVNQNQIDDLKQGSNKIAFHEPIKLDKLAHMITNDFSKAIANVEYMFIAIPSKKIKDFLQQYQAQIKANIIIVNASKGIDITSNKNYFEVIKSYLTNNEIAAISGPTFAIDLIKKNYSVANIIGTNKTIIDHIIKLLETDYFKLQPNYDETGSSIYSALKNVLAIGSGFLFGMNYSINTVAAFINLGIQEINQYVLMQQGKQETILDFCGIGDICLTCFSNQSRNYSYGYNLAKSPDKNDSNSTVEGISTINAIYPIIKNNDKFIILTAIYQLIHHEISKEDFIKLIWAKI